MLVKHVAIDLDDVILDFVGGLRQAVQREFGHTILDKDIQDFNLSPVLDPILGESWWGWLRRRDWLWSNFPVVDGAIGTIERLGREGYFLEIVTSKPAWADYAVWRWLGKWRPSVRRVTIVRSGDNKADFTDAPILIDDKMENAKLWIAKKPTALLFSRPHNSKEVMEPHSPIIRIRDWTHAHSVLSNLTTDTRR